MHPRWLARFMVRPRSVVLCWRSMPTSVSRAIAVLLIDLPGFYEALLRREFAGDSAISVRRVVEYDEALGSFTGDCVIVVRASAASLRRATSLSSSSRILGTVAVTDEEPRGDAYLVTSAGSNVSRHELAQVIRDVVAATRPVSAEAHLLP